MTTSFLTLHVKFHSCVKKFADFRKQSADFRVRKYFLDQIYILISTAAFDVRIM